MTLVSFINQLCRPAQNVAKNDFERELMLKRNKTMLFVDILIILMIIIYVTVTNKMPTPSQKASFTFCILIKSISLCISRAYPNLFKVIYFASLTSLGPFLIFYAEQNA